MRAGHGRFRILTDELSKHSATRNHRNFSFVRLEGLRGGLLFTAEEVTDNVAPSALEDYDLVNLAPRFWRPLGDVEGLVSERTRNSSASGALRDAAHADCRQYRQGEEPFFGSPVKFSQRGGHFPLLNRV